MNEKKTFSQISILFQKLLRKLYHNYKFHKYLKTNCLFEKHQSAHRQHHNTETDLIEITNDLLHSAADEKIVCSCSSRSVSCL